MWRQRRQILPLRLTHVGTAVLGPLSRPEVMDSSAAITMEGPNKVACAVQKILATGDHPVGGSLSDGIQPRDWLSKLAPYRDARNGRALVELASPRFRLWCCGWRCGSARARRLADPVVGGAGGRLPGPPVHDPARLRPRLVLSRSPRQRPAGRRHRCLTLTPYGHWRHEHALHHATSGNLDRRGRRRRRHADRAGIPGPPGDGAAGSIAGCAARSPCSGRPGVRVRPSASAADALPGRQPPGMASGHGDQSRHRREHSWAGGHGGYSRSAAGAVADHCGWPRRLVSGCSTCSISSSTPAGGMMPTGASMLVGSTAARTWTCHRCCDGSRRISACTMCIT